jgi:hypothetical protein
MADLERPAREIASSLDSGNESTVSQQLSAWQQSLSRDDFKQLLTEVDRVEKDYVGLELILKKDTQGTPVSYSIIPSHQHASVKQMAELMDRGAETEAQGLMQSVSREIFKNNAPDQALKKYGLWAMAVDAYERDGVGIDVEIDKARPGVDSVIWLKRQAAPQLVSQDSVSIPALSRGEEASEGATITVPKNSELVRLYEQVSPSVVQIIATRPGKIPGTTDTSYGSGFVSGSDGLIATNDHTFYGFDKISVRMDNGETYIAKIAAEDRENDVGLLKISPKAGEKFQPLEIEPDSKAISMQQRLISFGHPKGWSRTYVSEGTVSGATTLSKVDSRPNPPEENPNKHVIALQAHGEEGGSGGPVVNERGKVAGLAELASDSQRGQHIFMTQVEPLNALIARYRAQ